MKQKLPTKLAIRNIIIIVLCCVVLVVGVAHTVDFLRHRSTNVFEEMYNDYTLNHSELFSQIPIFYASDEFLWDGFSGVSQVAFDYKDSNSRRYYLEQAGIEIEAPLEENEHISIHLYEKPQQIVFLRQIITDTYVYTASYLYDCQSKTLTYTTSDPTMPKDTFLEDRILSAWFKYSHQDSPATCVVRQGKKPNYYTKFSLDNWGDVIIAE